MIGVTADLDRIGALCHRYGISRLEVFGSVARGEDDASSDIDLLYELEPTARLGFALFDLEDELAEIFGRPVDLVARTAINRHLAGNILSEARPLYAA